MSQSRSIHRVPFGLRDGRMYAPRDVPNGLACGCVCPGCNARLVARNAGTKVIPHFAHHGGGGCSTGYESAIHRMAKQIIMERGLLRLPAWTGGKFMPNPPCEQDLDGIWHLGEAVDVPVRVARLSALREEQPVGAFRPDLVATDEEGELLIEVLVTHEVTEAKAQWARSTGRRMVELDLGHLPQEVVEDPDRFEACVLEDVAIRWWISMPSAERAWHQSHRTLSEMVKRRNAEIEAVRDELQELKQKEEASRLQAQVRRETQRDELRARYAEYLEQLPAISTPRAIEARMRELKERDAEAAAEMVQRVFPVHMRMPLSCFSRESWVFGAHPSLWSAAAYLHFVQAQAAGRTFSTTDVCRWIRTRFGVQCAAWELFKAKDNCRVEAVRRGWRGHRGAWFFTPEENNLIPNFWGPINFWAQALIREGALVRAPARPWQLGLPRNVGMGSD